MSRSMSRHAEMYRAFVKACPPAAQLSPAEVLDGLAAAMTASRERLDTPPAFVRDIIEQVANEERVSVAHLTDSEQRRAIKSARRKLVRRLRDAGLSFPEIGVVMGGRDHSTIMKSYWTEAA